MSEDVLDLNPVSRITVGTIGRPGQRTFFLQAGQNTRTISLKIEKEQVNALALGIEAMFRELEEKELRPVSATEEPSAEELGLIEPLEPVFTVGQMGLVFDQSTDMLVLILQELTADENAQPLVARLWATLGQMRVLGRLAKEIVAQGRPICPLCQRPIDPDGHFCPKGNGHSKRLQED